mgnify:CR=1 FL=1
MIKTVIIDDEPAVVSIIKYFVKKENLPLDIVGTANRGDEGIEIKSSASFSRHKNACCRWV